MQSSIERFKTTPFAHQVECLNKFGRAEYFALLAEQGTGKTFIIINNMAQLWAEGEVNGVLVFAPNGVHTNWTKIELPKHMPDWVRYQAAAWRSSMNKKEKAAYEAMMNCTDSTVLRIFCMNWDALQTEKGFAAAERFAASCSKLAINGDETTMVKNPDASRTKALMRLKKYSRYRRIMNGTPVSNSPFDLFSQFSFLDETILQTTSYYAFKAEYAEMLTSGHHLVQSIVNKKVAMKPEIKNGLRKILADIRSRIAANGRAELIEAFSTISDAFENDNAEVIVQNIDYFKSLLNPAPSRAKTELLKQLHCIEDAFAAQMRKVAAAFNPNRLPQIVQRNKDGTPMYKNIERLEQLIAPHSFRVLKKDCLDLPEKIYKTVFYQMTKQQQEMYELMEKELRMLIEDEEVPVPNKLVALSKLTQITSGYFLPPASEEPIRIQGGNPRMELLAEWAERIVKEQGKKLIVWARYRVQLEDIFKTLTNAGIKCVEYHGGKSNEQKENAKHDFQFGDAEVFIAQQQSGGTGLTLTAASFTIYYSNTFSGYHRWQSEDRNHRIGQEESAVYIDFVAENSVDEKIILSLQNKKNIADVITGDQAKELLRNN